MPLSKQRMRELSQQRRDKRQTYDKPKVIVSRERGRFTTGDDFLQPEEGETTALPWYSGVEDHFGTVKNRRYAEMFFNTLLDGDVEDV